mgnify:CR=1 FL=1
MWKSDYQKNDRIVARKKKWENISKKTKKCVTNRQDAPIVYQLTGFQIINVPRFLKYKKIYMPRILPIEIPSKTGLMIDSEFEFQIANCMFRKR